MKKEKCPERKLSRIKVNESVFSLDDGELRERILAGDKKLLGDFLMGPCYPAFCAFSKRFYSLRLEPDEVVSIACKQLLASGMYLLRNYDPLYETGKTENADDENEETDEERKTYGLRRYVIRWTRKGLSKLLIKELERVGSGTDKRWALEGNASPVDDGAKNATKPPRKLVQTGRSYSKDDETLGTNALNVRELLNDFNMSAVELNICMAKLNPTEQIVFYLCSICGHSARVAAERLKMNARKVYQVHADSIIHLERMHKNGR